MAVVVVASIALTIPKNRKYVKQFTLRSGSLTGGLVDLSNYVITGQVRERAAESSRLIKDLVVTHNSSGGVITLVMDNSTIPVDVKSGYVDLVFTKTGETPATWAAGPVTFVDYPTAVTAVASASNSPTTSPSSSISSSPSASVSTSPSASVSTSPSASLSTSASSSPSAS